MDTEYILEVKENGDTGDLYVELPDSLLKQMGWNTGDELNIVANGDGSVTISK